MEQQPDAVRKLMRLLTGVCQESYIAPEIKEAIEAAKAAMPPEPEDPLKSLVFFASDFGPLGHVSITIPENNGGDDQFEADFEAALGFVKGVMERRKNARAQAIEARRAETGTGSVGDESAVTEGDAP